MSTLTTRRMMAASTLLGQPHTHPDPPTLLKRHAVDVSNYTSFMGLQALQTWRDQHDVGLVIVQSLDSGRFPQSRTIQQLIACQGAGLTVDLYVYPFYANGANDCWMRLSEALNAGVPIRRVHLDIEDVDPSQAAWTPSQRIEMIKRWLDACDAFPVRVRPASIYTGRWYWTDPKYMANTTEFSDRPLWDANYDHVDDADLGFVPYGGWTKNKLIIKQHTGTTALAGVSGVDLNVLSDAERKLT